MLSVSQIEAHDCMRDLGRSPIIHEQIDTANLREIDISRTPIADVVEFRPVATLAKVVNHSMAVVQIDRS